ncbi:MAG: GNAT family N-acetyltransferase [Psychrobium sp.]
MKIETERLIIEELTVNDTEFLIELLNQPSFKQNIGERYVDDEQSAINFLENGPFLTYPREIGMHCVRIKETREPIGLCGLMKRDYLVMPDLGYAFLEQVHGLGYASEAAREVVNWANFDKGYNRLCAMTTSTNEASINLLLKLGFEETSLPSVPNEMKDSRYFELPLN